MQPSPDFDAGKAARSLLRGSRQGALATLMAGSGDPYFSVVNIASHADGSPILLISRLALHTGNILADSRVSLMLDERAGGDPLEGSRIMVSGRAEEAVEGEAAGLRQRYLHAPPSAEAFVNFKDFSFFRIRPAAAHLVAGFGRIVDLEPAQFLTDISDCGALLEAEQDAIDHMNADHRDTMNLYATRLLAADPGDWRCTGCDPDGIDMQAGNATLRLDFPRRIITAAALRQVLKQLAEQARAAARVGAEGGRLRINQKKRDQLGKASIDQY